MPYEPGSPQCRVLIDCKSQVESMLLALSRIEDSGPIREQLRAVHQQLEDLHGRYRRSQPQLGSDQPVIRVMS
ncbi:MAG: hypothetical protein WBN89_09395 [Prochlorococcaceae cyanobacterium]